jgi:hypothetical protein
MPNQKESSSSTGPLGGHCIVAILTHPNGVSQDFTIYCKYHFTVMGARSLLKKTKFQSPEPEK